MRNITLIALSISLSALAACQTPYEERSAFGTWFLGGVHAERVDATTAKIIAQGNAYTSSSTIDNYIMLRAAEETLKDGFKYFTVVAGQDRTKYDAMPGFIAYNNKGAAYLPPTVSSYPGAAAVISMGNDPAPGSHDAAVTQHYLKALVD
jgi:hypothetical protein